MNFFKSLTRSSQAEQSETETTSDSSPFQYLAERREEEPQDDAIHESPRKRHERRFQERVATAKELETWIRPLLYDLQTAAYPNDRIHGFIHWINQDDDCPWILVSKELQYGSRHYGPRAELIRWETHPQPEIRWSIGRYPDHPYAKGQTWAYKSKVSIKLVFEDDRPHRLRVQLSSGRGEVRECKVELLDLTKTLVQLHP